MQRRWPALLALAFVATFARSADAERAACSCTMPIVLPAPGTSNVPLNTKLWVLDHTSDAVDSAATSLRVSPVAGESALEPNTEYTPASAWTRFTTGTERDVTPPAMPTNISASISVIPLPADYMPIDAIALWGNYDTDTALIKVDLSDGRRETTFYTTPQCLYLCSPGVSIRPGAIRMTIRAIDLAGNESAPATSSVDATCTSGMNITSKDCPGATTEVRHFRCGTGDLAVLFLIPIVAIGLLIGIVVVRLLRNARIRRTAPVEVGLLVAEAVVRMMLRGHLITSALGLVAIGVSLAFESHGLCFALAVIPFMGLSHALTCKVALRRLERIDAAAERRDTWLIISDRSGESRVRANERVFRAAVRAALPAASIERE